jgi:hypothetical protein
MGSSFCKYENKENCELLKAACEPGKKGCVLSGKLKDQSSMLKANVKTYKSKDIARFKEN